MVTETTKEKVLFGKKATQEIGICPDSTLYHTERNCLTRKIKVGGYFSALKADYQKVDFSEQKKMNACRQINKLIIGL